MPSPNTNSQHAVTAVIVAHDGAAWIPHVIEALLNQTRPVDRVVAVDTGSRDRSGAMLAEALGRGAVFGMDRGVGYGAAVHQALRHRAANTHLPPVPGASGERVEWIWLLHDDCEPETDALERLLIGAAQTPGVAVVGPKVMDWSDRDMLLEAGVTIDRVGRRITGIEPREMDQGQHDGDRDVLAVGSAGMLVRRDVWERAAGFDPGLSLYREDVDFCWRVLAAGHRVRVVTDAVVYHAEAASRNRRVASAAPHRARQDRRNALLVLAGNLPPGAMVSSLAGSFVLSLLRTFFFLLAKRPGAALDESAAYLSVVGHPLRLLSARRARARGRRNVYGRVRGFIPPGRSFRKLAEYASVALSRSHQSEMVGSHHATEDPSDDDSLLTDSGLVQRLLTNPGVLLFLALTVLTLVAARSLLASSPLTGGALAPAWGGASSLWQEYLQGFHPVGIGTAASTPPYVAVIAALATLLGGKPWLAIDVILIGAVPLAGLTAYLAARRVTAFTGARVWAAAAYALLPVGMGAVATGRIGAGVVLVLLPLAGLLVTRMLTQPRRRARRAAWATAFVVAVAAAFVPLAWVIAVLVMLAALLAFRRSRPVSPLNAVIVAVAPLVLLAPWTADLFAHPAQFFLEAGLHPAGLASAALPARSLLLLSPGGPGLPPWWVTAGLMAAAAVALFAGARRKAVLTGWGLALIGLVVAAVVSRVVATPAVGGPAVPAWPGVALATAGAGLTFAAAAGAEAMPQALRSGRWRSLRGMAALSLAVLAASAPLLAGFFWVVSGVQGPVGPSAGPLLPENVQVFAVRGARVRTLVLRVAADGSVQYSVLRASDPLIGSSELATPPDAQHALDVAVAGLAAADGRDLGNQAATLARFGIGYVLAPAPVNPALAHTLNGVAGLATVSQTSSFELWQVAGSPARVSVVEADGTVVPVASGVTDVSGARLPSAGGTLVIAEPAGGWSASVDGRPLTPVAAPVYGWAQGFLLPAGGGTLTITRSDLPRVLAVALEGLAVALVAALGLPGTRAEAAAEAEAEAEAAQAKPAASRQGTAGARRTAGAGTAGARTAGTGTAAADGGPAQAGPAGAGPGEASGSGVGASGEDGTGWSQDRAAEDGDEADGAQGEPARGRRRGKGGEAAGRRLLKGPAKVRAPGRRALRASGDEGEIGGDTGRGGRLAASAGRRETGVPDAPAGMDARGAASARPDRPVSPGMAPGGRRGAGIPRQGRPSGPRLDRMEPGVADRPASGPGSRERDAMARGGPDRPDGPGRPAQRAGVPSAPQDRRGAPGWDPAPGRGPGGSRPRPDQLTGRRIPDLPEEAAQSGRSAAAGPERPGLPGRRRRPSYGPSPDGAAGRGPAGEGAAGVRGRFGRGTPRGYDGRDAGHEAPDGGFDRRDGGYDRRDARYDGPDVGYDGPDVGYDGPDVGYDSPDGGYDRRDGGYGRGGGYGRPDGGYEGPEGGGPGGRTAQRGPDGRDRGAGPLGERGGRLLRGRRPDGTAPRQRPPDESGPLPPLPPLPSRPRRSSREYPADDQARAGRDRPGRRDPGESDW